MRSGRIQSCTSCSASSSSTFPHPPCLSSASRHCKFPLLLSPGALSLSQRVSRNCLVPRYSSGWSQTQFSFSKQSNYKQLLSVGVGALVTSNTQGISTGTLIADEKIGVLLLNLGGPETLEDVQPFLFNLFADPAEELRKSLWAKNVPAKVYVGMRYWHPFTEEAIEQIKRDGITKLVVLPLYPQFSISTSGSSLRLLESIFRDDEYLVNMQHTVIPSWYQREGYIKAMANLIEKELRKFDRPEKVIIFFSAHGVPLAYVEEAGDPYKAEMEECVDLIIEELEKRKIDNAYTLAYQSRVGPVEWLKPYTDETIVELGRKGVKSLLAVPISFVSEHIETLEEIDVEYKELALESGIENWGRVPALGCEPMFISDLADAVIESLPYVGAMAVSNLEARQSLVPLGSVEELLATYDSQRRELPPPVTVWEWGWTKSAETWNGRAAMLAVLVLLLLEVTTGEGFLHQWGVLPLFR
ncbi:ferrochelatase-2, chloroplastic isoform X3 [Durio zibethinus]|uniref:Ferrochelatase n=1 Tax=Durio zibethinus TaxID=66656 RepID=A0A6P5ZD86_DURZI|nr:ferrochelatase-2, chloroplastic isoform X3 [Durio zibethinus]